MLEMTHIPALRKHAALFNFLVWEVSGKITLFVGNLGCRGCVDFLFVCLVSFFVFAFCLFVFWFFCLFVFGSVNRKDNLDLRVRDFFPFSCPLIHPIFLSCLGSPHWIILRLRSHGHLREQWPWSVTSTACAAEGTTCYRMSPGVPTPTAESNSHCLSR